jgi:hypothetical protein
MTAMSAPAQLFGCRRADDYVVKPFAITEVVARTKALLRRPGGALGVVLQAGNIVLDTIGRDVRVGDIPLHLPRLECAILDWGKGVRLLIIEDEPRRRRYKGQSAGRGIDLESPLVCAAHNRKVSTVPGSGSNAITIVTDVLFSGTNTIRLSGGVPTSSPRGQPRQPTQSANRSKRFLLELTSQTGSVPIKPPKGADCTFSLGMAFVIAGIRSLTPK